MVHYKLSYFNLKGLGEPIRYMLSYMGKEFEDVRYEFEQWPKLKSTTPFGKLPVLETDGVAYSDSRAICRYLAKEAGLSGDNDLENLKIDQVDGAIGDFIREGTNWFLALDQEAKDKQKERLIKEIIPFYMDKFDSLLEKGGGYLANGKLSWVDIYFASYVDVISAAFEQDLEGRYKHFKSMKDNVFSLPGIKAWIDKRPATRW